MKRALYAVSLLSLGLPSVTAIAQAEAPIGSNIRGPSPAVYADDPRLSEADRARRVSYDFGRCIVAKKGKRLDQLVKGRLFGQALEHELKRVGTSECLSEMTLTMPVELMLGSIYRWLYIRDYAKLPPKIRSEPVDFRSYAIGASESEIGQHVLLMEFADCVVRADLGNSHNLIVSAPGSPAEKNSLVALSSKFGACLPKGLSVKFSRSVIAAILAEALFREAQLSIAPVSAGESH